MKRSVQLVSTLVVPCILLVFAGCGEEVGDVNGARSLLQSGDAQVNTLSEPFPDLSHSIERFFTEYAEAFNTDPVAAEEAMRTSKEQLQTFTEQAEQMKEPYRKVLALAGVKEYKEYARLRLNMLNQLKGAKDIVEKTFPILEKSMQAGRPPDTGALERAKRELIRIEEEFTYNEDEAKDLDTEKGLTR